MEHLTVDEIIDFISLTELNNDAIVLSATVNRHIRKCEKCLRLVRSFQVIYDEFSLLGSERGFKDFVVGEILNRNFENEKAEELYSALDEYDGAR